ncbi:hypothetical protein MFLO_07307 [Listeria floridensis FSL S10-1187]|uniref:VanZ/RDD domain-containing protein n=1 Tax=Listeria floridensis FSL S10-1187 TaxID=1265817 RepID=A0ABN0RFD4_9LIST|nr:VanZ family protein [Listeria floridensis]EUJ31978.1 hypothetical protein MFLO_07307 [Listeria floridensis FSL S10-1187]
MSSYLVPIKAALFTFPFLAILLTIPFAIYSYRKFGSITFMRVFVIFTFIFYLMAAFFMTVLPLPEINEVAKTVAPSPQLIPFTFIREFINQTVLVISQPATYLPALTQDVVIQPVFNIFLLLPLGVYLRYYFRFPFWKTALIAFFTSLFFELTQLTGIYGIYPHAYRLFDVDDLMLNTAGGMLGFALAPLFTFFLPSRETMDSSSTAKSERVGYLRRFLAFLIDWFLIDTIGRILLWINIVPSKAILGYTSQSYERILFDFIAVFLYFIVLQTLTNGLTLGKWLVRIRIINTTHTRINFRQLFGRYALLYYVTGGLIMVPLNQQVQATATTQINLILIVTSLAVLFLFGLHLLINLFRKDKRLFYEKMSHTLTISTFKSKKQD